jgi:hypothetical protein
MFGDIAQGIIYATKQFYDKIFVTHKARSLAVV